MRPENSGDSKVVKKWLSTRVSDSSDAQLSDNVLHYGVKNGWFGRQRPFSDMAQTPQTSPDINQTPLDMH